MAERTRSVLRKLLKIVLWIFGSLLLLIFVTLLLLQLPPVQTKLAQTVVHYISERTHTTIAVKKIRIKFTGAVALEGIFANDLRGDTLLSAENIEAAIDLPALLHHELKVRALSLSGINLRLSRTSGDSLFNFNFLLTAFSPTAPAAPKDTASSGKALSIQAGNITLKNIRMVYDDRYAGLSMGIGLKEMNLSVHHMDLKRLSFDLNALVVNGLKANLSVRPAGNKTEHDTSAKSTAPLVNVGHISLRDALFAYTAPLSHQQLLTYIGQLDLKKPSLDLGNQTVKLDKLFLSQSLFNYTGGTSAAAPEQTVVLKEASAGWKVSAAVLELNNNRFAYQTDTLDAKRSGFDPSHLHFNTISLQAKNAYYSPDSMSVKLLSAAASDPGRFSLRKAAAEVVMTRKSIRAKQLEVITAHSRVNATVQLYFSSLAALKDSLGDLDVFAAFRQTKLSVKDALYFSSGLASRPFFNNASNYATLSGTLKGRVNNLHGHSILVRSGISTELESDFTIVGLPDINNAKIDVPRLYVASGSKDLAAILGSLIPSSVALPGDFDLTGKFKGTLKAFVAEASLNSDFGNAELKGQIDEAQVFSAEASTEKFDLGKLLKKTGLLGPLTLNLTANGKGLNPGSMKTNLALVAGEAYLNGYTYHHLTAEGAYDAKVISGTVKLEDAAARFDLQGLADLNSGSERIKLDLDLKGADLQKLNLQKQDLRIALKTSADLKGKDLSSLNGKVAVTGLVIVHEGKTYLLDSLLAAAINESGRNELNLKSAVITLKYQGDLEPGKLAGEIKRHIDFYFQTGERKQLSPAFSSGHFNFELELNDHPVLSEVFLPKLKEFSGLHAKGSFSGGNKKLDIKADLKQMVYAGLGISDLSFDLSSDASALTYSLIAGKLSGPSVEIDRLTALGRLADQKAELELSSTDSAGRKKLLLKPLLIREDNRYKLSLDPSQFYLMNKRWEVSKDNYVLFGREGVLIHDLAFSRAESQLSVNSKNNRFKDDIDLSVKNFLVEDLSGIFEKDTSLVKGTINGGVQLKRSNATYGFIADLGIAGLEVREIPVGDLSLKADQNENGIFDFRLSLSGHDNKIGADGTLTTAQGKQRVDLTLKLEPLSLKTVEAASFGSITQASGNLEGTVHVKGDPGDPDLSGTLSFKNAHLTPHFTNSPLELANETITINGRQLSFNGFTIADKDKHKAVINGSVDLKRFADPVFALGITTSDFMLMNSTSQNNKELFGRLIMDGKINLKGPAAFPVVNSNLTLKNGTNFAFAVPESKLSTDRGEGVVVFEDTVKLNPILTRHEKDVQQKSRLKGMDVSAIIRVEKKAILKLLPDPSTSDSLVVQGNANLSLAIDPSGKLSLTGLYELKGGNYQVSLENVVKKQFRIMDGSTITWNGDPLDAEVNIKALYTVRTSPIDLVADQVSSLSEGDKNAYKQRFPFLVYLKLRGQILKPEISFDIELPDADKGALGGSVNARLAQLADDPSALNKQVFALLVLGRFIQENPLQSESGGSGAQNAVRASVGKFLTSELNQLGSKLVPGVELNFDVQSYDDYSGGNTAVAVGVKKQLFNEKVSVQVGGTVDVEGEKARQNNASDITGDVLMEYKVTDDGRYRLKGFRRNQYEGAIEGQVIETGGGVLYVKDFDKWEELFRSPARQAELKNMKR